MVAGTAVWTWVVGGLVVGGLVVGGLVVGGSAVGGSAVGGSAVGAAAVGAAAVGGTIAHLARWRALLLWRLKFERSSDPKLQEEQVCFFML
jgi:hypothetical protein